MKEWQKIPIKKKINTPPQFLNSNIIKSIWDFKNIFQELADIKNDDKNRLTWKEMALKFRFINENVYYLLKIYHS